MYKSSACSDLFCIKENSNLINTWILLLQFENEKNCMQELSAKVLESLEAQLIKNAYSIIFHLCKQKNICIYTTTIIDYLHCIVRHNMLELKWLMRGNLCKIRIASGVSNYRNKAK